MCLYCMLSIRCRLLQNPSGMPLCTQSYMCKSIANLIWWRWHLVFNAQAESTACFQCVQILYVWQMDLWLICVAIAKGAQKNQLVGSPFPGSLYSFHNNSPGLSKRFFWAIKMITVCHHLHMLKDFCIKMHSRCMSGGNWNTSNKLSDIIWLGVTLCLPVTEIGAIWTERQTVFLPN